MRGCRSLIALTSLAAALLADSAARAAGLTLIAQDRRVHSSAFASSGEEFDNDAQNFTAPDGGPFDATAIASVEISGVTAGGLASQISEIGPAAILASGSYSTELEIDAPATIVYALVQTNVAVRFTVPEATTYVLQGTLEAFDGGGATLQLSRPFQTVEWFTAEEQQLVLDASGEIEAGTYDLNVSTLGTANETDPERPSGGYDVQLLFGLSTGAPVVSSSSFAAFPNPFSAQTRIVLPDGSGKVRVMNLAGRIVRTLSGPSPLVWDGRDDAGRALAAGVYWVRPEGAGSEPIKVVRVK